MTERVRRPAGDDGFTLVELLVALVLIGTALTAMLAAFLTSAKAIQSQSERTEAARIGLDRNESLRLAAYDDPVLNLGTRTGQSTGNSGRRYTLTTEVVERDSRPSDVVAGDTVKDVKTTVTWSSTDGATKSITYTSAVARDARTIGVPSGYVQAIRSMSVAPDPSVVVDTNGHTTEDVLVTISMTGHAVSEVVTITWTDDRGLQSATASSTDGRFWRVTIARGGGIKKVLAPRARFDMVFASRTQTSGLTATSSLALYGPLLDPPTICETCFTVSPNPITTIGNGRSRFENKTEVVFRCVVSGLDVSAASTDSVRVRFPAEDQTTVEQVLTRTSAAGVTPAVYAHTFARSTYYFGIGPSQTYTCVAKRSSDGGPASSLKLIAVTT